MSVRDYAVSDPLEQRLLDAVTAAPDDAETRSVYADWLESVGGFAHAEFLRTQLALAAVQDATDPAFRAAAARLAELASRLEPGWRARVAIAFVEGCPSEIARRSMSAITIEHGTGEQRRVVFARPEITIGSVQGNDLVLEGSDVDNRHARIVLKDGKYIIVDLRSTNGTHVNGRRLASPLVVRATDRIYIGAFVITVGRAALGERPVVTSMAAATRLAMELVCPQRWDWLTPTQDAGVRHCDACKRDVHYCTSVDEARLLATSGGCVAIDLLHLPTRVPGDLDRPPRGPPVRVMGIPAPPQGRAPRPRPPPTPPDDFDAEEATTPRGERT